MRKTTILILIITILVGCTNQDMTEQHKVLNNEINENGDNLVKINSNIVTVNTNLANIDENIKNIMLKEECPKIKQCEICQCTKEDKDKWMQEKGKLIKEIDYYKNITDEYMSDEYTNKLEDKIIDLEKEIEDYKEKLIDLKELLK